MDVERLWREVFPGLSDAGDAALKKLMQAARIVELPSEKTIFQPGSACGHYYLLLEGSIRVLVLTTSGREVLLYRVQRGEGCVITTSCLLGDESYNVYGITDGPIKAFSSPSHLFHETLRNSERFRAFVFRGFAQRLALVLGRLADLVEGNIDQMLADALITLALNGRVNVTHQALADQIGTAREVVSRHLKRFESQGWLHLSRGCISLLDPTALRACAAAGNSSHRG